MFCEHPLYQSVGSNGEMYLFYLMRQWHLRRATSERSDAWNDSDAGSPALITEAWQVSRKCGGGSDVCMQIQEFDQKPPLPSAAKPKPTVPSKPTKHQKSNSTSKSKKLTAKREAVKEEKRSKKAASKDKKGAETKKSKSWKLLPSCFKKKFKKKEPIVIAEEDYNPNELLDLTGGVHYFSLVTLGDDADSSPPKPVVKNRAPSHAPSHAPPRVSNVVKNTKTKLVNGFSYHQPCAMPTTLTSKHFQPKSKPAGPVLPPRRPPGPKPPARGMKRPGQGSDLSRKAASLRQARPSSAADELKQKKLIAALPHFLRNLPDGRPKSNSTGQLGYRPVPPPPRGKPRRATDAC